MLTVGIPETIAPLPKGPTPEMITAAQQSFPGVRIPSATQVKVAYGCGYSRPFIESLIDSLTHRGGTPIKYKGHRGAILQTTMAIMAHNAATLVRIKQDRLSQRAQKFRRFLRLKPPNSLQDTDRKN